MKQAPIVRIADHFVEDRARQVALFCPFVIKEYTKRLAQDLALGLARVDLLTAGEEGLEPPTARFGDVCSAKLSYSPTPQTF